MLPARPAADLPAGYPLECRRVVTLRDGRSVLIRPILPSDAPALAEAIKSADDTIRRRFLGGQPQVTPGLLEFLSPGWRGAGLASELIRMLARAASERGIHAFTGAYFAENRPVTALINTTDEPADQVTSHGVATFSITLPPPDPGN